MSANDKHILIVAGHFSPESTSGTHRSLHFARALVESGFRVSVVTVDRASIPSVDVNLDKVFPYEDRIVRVARRKNLDSIYADYKRWRHEKRTLPVANNSQAGTGLPQPTSPNAVAQRSTLRRELAGLLTFPDHHRGWHGPASEAARAIAAREPVDAIFASGPPWTALRVAREVSRKIGCTLVTDFRDPWTDSMGHSLYESKLLSLWAAHEETKIIRDSAAVLFNSPYVMAAASRHYANVRAAFQCVLNGTDMEARKVAHTFSHDQNLVIAHFGSLYGGRSIAPLLTALAAAADGIVDVERITVRLVGPVDSNTTLGIDLGTGLGLNMECVSLLTHSEAAGMMTKPSVLLTVQSQDFAAQIPTKVYEYLSTGNPVLVLAQEGSAVWQVAKDFNRCRRLDFDDSHRNAEHLRDLLTKWASGGLSQVPADQDTAALQKDVIGRDFANMMRSLLEPNPRATTRGDGRSEPGAHEPVALTGSPD